MKTITRAVYDFMDRRLGLYANPFEVEIILDERDAISVSCQLPGERTHNPFFIELEFDSDTIEEFVSAFGITSVRHMATIRPLLLMELYHQGKAVIFSAINNPAYNYSLHFRKQHNIILVKGTDNVEETVHEPLETSKEYTAYTLQHYRLAGKS